jgi:hypothetical protein
MLEIMGAAQGVRESPCSFAEEPEKRAESHAAVTGGAREDAESPWWRRMYGG